MSSNLEQKQVPKSICSSSVLAATLACVLMAEVVGLGLYGYYRVQRALAPENLADRAVEAIRANYPEVRQEIVTQVKSESPEIAEQVSQQIIASTPEARKELEQFTARQVEIGLDQATELSADQFRDVLRENHDQFVKIFEAIEDAPEEAHELVLETEASIEKQLGVDLQRQARQALRAHRQLNEKLARLASNQENLSSKELLERRIVRILRTMQEQRENEARVAAVPQGPVLPSPVPEGPVPQGAAR